MKFPWEKQGQSVHFNLFSVESARKEAHEAFKWHYIYSLMKNIRHIFSLTILYSNFVRLKCVKLEQK